MLSLKAIESRLWTGGEDFDPHNNLAVSPDPSFSKDELGNVGLDAHLGSWFATFRDSDIENLSIGPDSSEEQVVRSVFVQLGHTIILHPGQFLLGVTLEWFRVPENLAAHVVGKSSWGRRGLIIATATGVQPGFGGCLTLEIANVGKAPIKLETGVPICQLFFEEVVDPTRSKESAFAGSRKPRVGRVKRDRVSELLAANPTYRPERPETGPTTDDADSQDKPSQ